MIIRSSIQLSRFALMKRFPVSRNFGVSPGRGVLSGAPFYHIVLASKDSNIRRRCASRTQFGEIGM